MASEERGSDPTVEFLFGSVQKWVMVSVLGGVVAMVALARWVGGFFDAADVFTVGAFWIGVLGVVGSIVWARGGFGRLGVRETAILGVIASSGAAILLIARVMKGTAVAEWGGLMGLVMVASSLGFGGWRLTVGLEGDD